MSRVTKDEEALMENVNKILKLDESTLNPTDIIFIEYLKYIFTQGFNQESLTLPVKKKEGVPFKYLSSFVKVLSKLFDKKENERDILYQTETTDLSNELKNIFLSLDKFLEKKNIIFNTFNLFDKIIYIMYNYYNGIKNKLSDLLTYYLLCLNFFIPKTNMIKIILYNFLKQKFQKLFGKLDYKNYCPDFESNNCLNLIISFFEKISKSKLEILVVYATLIFKYDEIFIKYKNDINK